MSEQVIPDTDTKPAKAPKPAKDAPTKGQILYYDPLQLAIHGGKDMPDEQRGPLDTPTDKAHPLYDERLKLKLTPEWVANIGANGVREVTEIAMLDGVPFVVNGRQRVRGARVANPGRTKEGLPPIKVPCLVVRLDDLGMLREMVITNIHQDDSTATKIAKLKRLMARGVTVEDAATTFAIKAGTAKAWLAYDDNAIASVKAAVNAGKIPSTTGMDIARLDKDKQQGVLDSILATATTDKGDRKQRKGQATKAKRVIARAAKPDASPGVGDKKTLRRFLAAVEATSHPGAQPSTLAWWSGVEDCLCFVLGQEGADKRLLKILDNLDDILAESSPEPESDEDTE